MKNEMKININMEVNKNIIRIKKKKKIILLGFLSDNADLF